MYKLGVCYEQGTGVQQDCAEAFEWYQKAADAGSISAMHGLGKLYFEGRGVRQDHAKFVAWLQKAAGQGCDVAMYKLGMVYFDGTKSIPIDYKKAVEWFRKAKEAGHTGAVLYIAAAYEGGRGVMRDEKRALDLLREAAEAGNPVGTVGLSIMYYFGSGVKRDEKKAASLLHLVNESSTISEDLAAGVKALLGLIYGVSMNPCFVKTEMAQAEKWVHMAISADCEEAERLLDYCASSSSMSITERAILIFISFCISSAMAGAGYFLHAVSKRRGEGAYAGRHLADNKGDLNNG